MTGPDGLAGDAAGHDRPRAADDAGADDGAGLAGIVPEGAAAAAVRSAGTDRSLLWPEEAAALGTVAPARARDFVNGRRCARTALARLGLEPVPVDRGPRGEPCWPPGVVGAITHTALGPRGGHTPAPGYAAAVVAWARRVPVLGLDAEPDEPLPAGVLDRIARPEERHWLDPLLGATPAGSTAPGVALGAAPGALPGVAHPDRLLFCLKEAVYKAWYPATGRWLGFGDARVTPTATGTSCAIEILVDGPLPPLTGRWFSTGGVVAAVVAPQGVFPD
ncbi:MAG: 4'-phosphopantetheinyl transferase [Acidimicrobiales bacterium]